MSNVKVIHPHDPLCPSLNCIDSGCDDCCRCDLITRVREDERIAAAGRVSAILHWSQDDDGLVCNWNRAAEAAMGEQR